MSRIIKASLSPVFVEGLLYASLAIFLFLQSYFGSDEAAKYVSPVALFWIKAVIGSLASACGAVKMFRSTTYSDHVNKTQINTSATG